jgi:SAM-dependent methyltransferase
LDRILHSPCTTKGLQFILSPANADLTGAQRTRAISTKQSLAELADRINDVYSKKIRDLSFFHWTPFAVACKAANLLVTNRGTRVLDIGCGPGKFCLIGASLSEGSFTGVEQRRTLVNIAAEAAMTLGIPNVTILHGNVTDISFSDYDAFYLYNPFDENLFYRRKIDREVSFSPTLLRRYQFDVANKLGQSPLGTRVVTYSGFCDEIPGCYDCESAFFGNELKLWIKRRAYDADVERWKLTGSRSYRGMYGWAPRRSRP